MNLIYNNKTAILEYLFPKFCVGCEKEGSFLCQKCRDDILAVKSQVCPKCNKLSLSGKYCLRCRDENVHLRGIIAATYFEEGPIKDIIHNFKYNSVTEFKVILGKMMAEIDDFPEIDIVTFAPLHPKRFAQRGYNQAELLAEQVARKTRKEKRELVIKIKNTKRQVGLKGQKRQKNLQGVFKAKKGTDFKNKKIIIVDDICTTGTTLNECGRVLKEAGAKEVWGLVVARG